MQSLDALNLLPVWVNPEHLAMTAKIILAGHKLKVLGVVEGSELVGIITSTQTKDIADNVQVRAFMTRPERIVDASTPLRQLAETFWQEDLDYIPIVQNDKFRGIVTPNMLLKEMARSWDPLTGLSWSDRLREWGVEHLKDGSEITIIFIDLDDFGSYNKKYGHIVGDRVLQKVADMIQERIETDRDQLVRYGGDEFAIGTLRDQTDSMNLARSLREGMSRIRVAGSDEPVAFSIGVQGGKRTKERENVHYAATLDNLINLASKNSMAEKTAKKSRTPVAPAETEQPTNSITAISGPAASEPDIQTSIDPEAPVPQEETPPVVDNVSESEEITPETASDLAESHGDVAPPPALELQSEPEAEMEVESHSVATVVPLSAHDHAVVEESEAETPPAVSRPLRIGEVLADAADANSVTQVMIDAGDKTVTGVFPRKGGSVVKSVALATANAIAQLRPDVRLEIREVNLTESETGVRFISVIGTSKINGQDQPIGGVGTVGRNLYLTVAEATLQAYSNFEAVREGTKDS